ncbi:unnamed protein product [Protopolystoma xenopodis]|uniref:Uncharacterized protein n=1 Tax=Protopolystoma xenopodis TaxID=117903 RepID=A0A448XQ14_9PLAT|nr:unnamed protein product [Protopolystoma xenopodis]
MLGHALRVYAGSHDSLLHRVLFHATQLVGFAHFNSTGLASSLGPSIRCASHLASSAGIALQKAQELQM